MSGASSDETAFAPASYGGRESDSRRERGPEPSPAGAPGRTRGTGRPGLGTALAIAGIGIGVALAVRSERRHAEPAAAGPVAGAAARQVRDGAAILGASVLADSAVEHFHGRYHNRAMYVAPSVAAATATASVVAPESRGGRRAVDGTQLAAFATGAAGLLFHTYNVTKRPGGISWNNLFYAAPLGAPGALTIAGLLGLAARRIEDGALDQRIMGRLLAALSGASLLGTTAEVALLHFRGAFHNPAMWLPVTIPPATGLALLGVAAKPAAATWRGVRPLLLATAALGVVGTGFHAYGVGRNMGGWGNWRQNMLAGPPMPAPISFTGIALAGLAALSLLRRRGREEDYGREDYGREDYGREGLGR